MAWIAFLPWLRLKEPVKAGRYELLPYDAKSQTTNPEPVEAIKSLFAPYWQRGDLPGRFSTVVRRDGQLVHDDDIRDEEVNELFRFSEYLAFAGLAEREYFSHQGYWNRDHFRLIIQKYTKPDGSRALVTRRRDGQNTLPR